jgi:hypothetical protein
VNDKLPITIILLPLHLDMIKKQKNVTL